MAVPFRKTSKRNKRMRRSHDALKPSTLTKCTNCAAIIKPHHVCSECGFYKGKQIKEVKEK